MVIKMTKWTEEFNREGDCWRALYVIVSMLVTIMFTYKFNESGATWDLIMIVFWASIIPFSLVLAIKQKGES